MAEQLIKDERPPVPAERQEFFPKGAIAFFAAMLVLFGVVWLALYVLMIYRR